MLDKARRQQQLDDCEVERKPLHPEIALADLCSEMGFVTHMTSEQKDNNNAFQPAAVTSDWKFGEDEKGKPGWIIDLNGSPYVENNISFRVEIGQGRRRLETTYLKSHTHIGAANAVLRTTEGVVVVVVGGFWIQAWERGGHVCLHPCLSVTTQ